MSEREREREGERKTNRHTDRHRERDLVCVRETDRQTDLVCVRWANGFDLQYCGISAVVSVQYSVFCLVPDYVRSTNHSPHPRFNLVP